MVISDLIKSIKIWCKVLIICAFSTISYGQVLNDNCQFAFGLPSADNYCSKDAEFTNINAKADPTFPNTCVSLLWQNGVWFSFIPREPGALIRVFGSGQGGTARNPKIVLFEKCGRYLQCSPGKTIGNDELLIDNLNIGQVYYFMVETAVGGEGTFRLCVNDFIPVKAPEADCRTAVVLCDKSSFVVRDLTGVGSQNNEIEAGNCMEQEFQSAWYKWTCDVAGTLTFVLTPNNHRDRNTISDDLDFALYELPNGINDCGSKRLLRCMASGANGDGTGGSLPLSQWINCNGPTGLMIGDNDITEAPGCQTGNNNFVSALNMEVGKSYVLVVNNYSRSGLGFEIDFGGTGTFLGPKPDFEINANNAFECDKSVQFTNKSTSATDPIVRYTWNFGDRAVPERQSGQGPFGILYESFGDKIAALTVESSRGCLVTKIKEFFVQPCCKDTSTLDVNAVVTDLRCFEIPEGQILAQGLRGAPDYKFSIDGRNFRTNPLFGNLKAGNYQIIIEDLKGCKDSISTMVNQPPQIEVDAGEDQTIEFGNTTFLSATFVSANGSKLFWAPEDDFDINGISKPEVYPKTTTTYILTLTDNNGCTKNDNVTIRVNKEYKVAVPNIFTPDDSGNNDFFNIWTNRSVKYVELLEVYDRWGNLVYQGVDSRSPESGNLIVNDVTEGWDGLFQNKRVNPGVFAWRAKVRFIDDEVKNFAGDLTLLR